MLLLAPAPGLLAAQVVEHPPVRDLDEPAARVVRQPVARPLLGGRDQRLLDGVLRGGEVVVAAQQRAEDLRREVAQQVLDRSVMRPAGGADMTCRTSIGRFSCTPPGPGAAEIAAAISIARSRLSTSITQ